MGSVLRIALPLTAWLACFSAIYGLNAWLCAAGLPGAAGRGVLIGAVLAALSLQVALLVWVARSPASGLRAVATTLAIVALVGTAWTLLPGLMLTRCI
ncbi:hypothetical protein Q4511_15200 [Paracoccus sp. 1_MG-2023]|uniref:hypothetical protein n=1 Tax=unclassified Paracoccus (in: a-proteobacteria) TaxID=2688777 RepID=UPI001C0A07F2|nr:MULTISPECIES: hypothetical protein [unclassified Paracoccus (in: a-proteobacteria)]MBU2958350.1 hypothetical protein [Paracoccus sp. C2R09]MDO6670270.1 hypothetical protein [Paracoccus sp. 1_MG-2023]